MTLGFCARGARTEYNWSAGLPLYLASGDARHGRERQRHATALTRARGQHATNGHRVHARASERTNERARTNERRASERASKRTSAREARRARRLRAREMGTRESERDGAAIGRARARVRAREGKGERKRARRTHKLTSLSRSWCTKPPRPLASLPTITVATAGAADSPSTAPTT